MPLPQAPFRPNQQMMPGGRTGAQPRSPMQSPQGGWNHAGQRPSWLGGQYNQQPMPMQAQPQTQNRAVPTPNLQQNAQQAVQNMFPEMLQGLQGYGQPTNFPMQALSQMATQAGQSRADMLSSGLDRDMSSALAQLFQQGRQQQIGMTGDIGNFNIGLYGQQQQEQQSLARLLQSLMLGMV